MRVDLGMGDFCATRTKLSRVSSVHGYTVSKDLTQRVFAAGGCTWTLCSTVSCRLTATSEVRLPSDPIRDTQNAASVRSPIAPHGYKDA